ncbi:MAG: stage II sporulation protein M [Owenweeksia sp.]|nr:stage II sporulation protein M [Owenweeksia sp.]
MNETSFIKANIKRWEQFESWLKQSGQIDPDRLAGLYLQLTDDLSYARTHYQNGEITHYLNNLATKVHSRIYRNKKEKKNRFVSFWKYEVPSVSYRYRKNLLYSFIIFGLAMVIGAVSAEQDASFVRLILGDSYVNMTEANIEKDDPMAVYKSMGRMDMFLAITFNNVRVSLMAFAAGILLSFGTGLMLFYNGIMLGSFQYFFYQKGLLLTSVLSIWIHGTLEISAIIIAGAAGLILGNSILFPGTYTRSESLRRGARDGLKLVMGLVPIFVVAGFLESFITRLTGAPPLVKALIIVISAFFILYYFLIYPAQLAKNGKLIRPTN